MIELTLHQRLLLHLALYREIERLMYQRPENSARTIQDYLELIHMIEDSNDIKLPG
jgi:hypothetical protein